MHTEFLAALKHIKEDTSEDQGGFLTYKGASFGVEFSGHADVSAQVQHDKHGGNHDDALPQQQRLKVATKSEG